MSSLPQRRVARTVTLPPASPGFLGPGHTAVEVLDPEALEQNDPFILLMDDRLDLSSEVRKMGGAHPHAGLETVTLFLEGAVKDRDEGDTVPGDAQWMTAGRGVIHSENMEAAGRVRILQLWIRLPKAARAVPPRVQLIKHSTMPIRREPGVEARVYSGASGTAVSATKNYAQATIIDFSLEHGASLSQELPSSYSGFLYVLEGTLIVGEERWQLNAGQVGSLNRPEPGAQSALRLEGGEGGARVVLYSGEPQREPLLHHGPFVAGSREELVQLFNDYRENRFERLSGLIRE
jgi:redox-sensitive bicupin YhaK (pirin superfamily)